MINAYSQQTELEQRYPQNPQLKILMLCWEFPPNMVGGLSRHVFGLSVQLAKMGHEVHVLTACNGNLPSFEKMNGVNVYRVTPLNGHDNQFLYWIGGLNLAMAIKAEKLAQKTHFDLIHAHDWLVGSAAVILKNLLGIPLLSTIHATEHGRNNGIHNEMQQFIHEKEKQLISYSDQIIVCSEYMKDTLASIFQGEEKKVVIITNGIELPIVELKSAEIFPELANRNYIFSIGRMVKEKGFDTLLEAAAIAKEMNLNYFFIIAGKGPMLDSYRRQAEERKLQNHIAFVGFVQDEQRNALIQDCEMAVIPSLYEPFGIAALEMMILGKPTIVSNTGGLKGIVKHLQTGLLMIPEDAHSLLEQIQFLSKNPERANEIGRMGSDMVRNLYGWKRIAAKTARIMKDILLDSQVNGEAPNILKNKL